MSWCSKERIFPCVPEKSLLKTDVGVVICVKGGKYHQVQQTKNICCTCPLLQTTRTPDLLAVQEMVFESGELVLQGEDSPCLPATVSFMTDVDVAICVKEGKYHQVRRMVASCGNHVKALHRISVGQLHLDGLEPGQYIHLDNTVVDLVQGTTVSRLKCQSQFYNLEG